MLQAFRTGTLFEASKLRILFTKLLLFATLMLLAFSTVSTISDSESRQFPEGTNIHEGFPWRNGDHMYYVSSALQIAGIPYEQALLDTTNEFNDWPGEPKDLNLGYLSMDFSPLVYPRFTFPLFLSWGYQGLGFMGMFAIPLLLFATTTGFLIYWVRKSFGVLPAIGALIASASSVLFVKYGSGLFIESVVFLIQVSWLFLLPMTTTSKQKYQKLLMFNMTVALLALTRQMPFLPLFVLLAGYLSASIIHKNWRNQWLPFLLTGSVTTVTMYLLVSFWAPYDPIPYLTAVYGAPTGAAFIPWTLNHLLDALIITGTGLAVKDPAMFLLIPLGLLGGWYLRKKTITWIAAGAWLASSSTLALNLPEYRFWAPGIVFSIPLIGYGMAILATTVIQVRVNFKDESSQVLQDGQDWSISSKTSNRLLLSTLALSMVIGTSLASRYNTEERLIFSEPVSTYGWTDAAGKSLNGFVKCQGNDAQLVYVSQSEQTFPMTGTAKAKSFGQHEFIAFNSDGSEVDYVSQQQLIIKCLSSNSIADIEP